MPTHETIFDFIAARFRQLGSPEYSYSRLILDAEREGYGDVYEISTKAVANALLSRGLQVSNGIVSFPQEQGEHFDPIATDYERFTTAARTILRDAEHPIPTHHLIAQIGLPKAAVPYAAMADFLREVDIFFIPGVGYWRAPQWTMPDGTMITKRIGGHRAKRLRELFEQTGWPIVGREAEEQTNGIVTARWLSLYPHSTTNPIAAGIGSGLFVPRDLLTPAEPLPMSANVATAFADLDDAATINDKDHFRLFRIALRAGRLDLAHVRLSRTTKGGQRIQTMKLEWTSKGLAQLRRAVHQTTDVF